MWSRIIGLIVILALGLYAEVLPADTQEPARMPRIGMLLPGSPNLPGPLVPALRDLGYVDGQNIVLEPRYAKGNLNRFSDLIAELVNLPVDILVSGGIAASLAAKRATTTIPIVFTGTTDPVGRGLVTNLARPGGNITGVAFDSGSVIVTKRLQLLKEAVPTITRVAYIHGNVRRQTPDGERKARERREKTARALGLTIEYFRARSPEEIKERVFLAIKADPHPFDALYMAGPVVTRYRQQIADFAIQNRLPSMGIQRLHPEAGALMSYGPNFDAMGQRTAVLIDKILRGAKPGDLPIEQPTKYDFIINLKTARTLGITIPPLVLYQATRVIR